jgi:hypothetical protein
VLGGGECEAERKGLKSGGAAAKFRQFADERDGSAGGLSETGSVATGVVTRVALWRSVVC